MGGGGEDTGEPGQAGLGAVTGTRAPLSTAGVLVVAGLLTLVLGAAGCGSGQGVAAGTGGTPTTSPGATPGSSPGSSPGATTATSSPPTSAGQLPTVSNCGGGAYEPKTLLIVCGSGTAMATGVSWQSWTAGSASGTGTVHLVVKDQPASAPANLKLDQVKTGPVGPQFSRLTVTWTGASPDGRTQDTYPLQLG